MKQQEIKDIEQLPPRIMAGSSERFAFTQRGIEIQIRWMFDDNKWIIRASSRENLFSGFATRVDSKRPSQLQKLVRGLNFGYKN